MSDYEEMLEVDFDNEIDCSEDGVSITCPECGTAMYVSGHCATCPACGFSLCSM